MVEIVWSKNQGGLHRPPLSNFVRGLRGLNVLRLPALRSLDYIELYRLAFLQAAKAIGLDGGEVNENIFAILAADETITFSIVKPLYCSCFHVVLVFLCVEICAEFR